MSFCRLYNKKASIAVRFKTVILLLLFNCLLLLPLSVLGPCFVMQYFVSFLVLQSSRWGKESLLLYFYSLLNKKSNTDQESIQSSMKPVPRYQMGN